MATKTSSKEKSRWGQEIVVQAVWESFVKLNPRTLGKNPVMFVVEVGAALTSIDLGRGKAQAEALRKSRAETMARRLKPDGSIESVPGSQLRAGDLVMVCAGEFVPGDGEVIEGVASVDESAITGESAPVIRESGGDRSAVTGGTRVLSDEIKVRITSNPGETFLD